MTTMMMMMGMMMLGITIVRTVCGAFAAVSECGGVATPPGHCVDESRGGDATLAEAMRQGALRSLQVQQQQQQQQQQLVFLSLVMIITNARSPACTRSHGPGR
jgi:hypothetical protein